MEFWDLKCVRITIDFENFHVFGKNQTYVGISTGYLNFRVSVFFHTCVVFTTYLGPVEVFGKNHTCV